MDHYAQKLTLYVFFRSDEGGSYQGSSTEELIGSQNSDRMSVESDDQQMDENLSTHSRDETEGLISGVNTPELGSPEKSTTDPPEIADPNVDERYLITPNKPPTKIVKKVMLVTDSNLKNIQVEKEVEEPITLTTTADYRPIPLRQPTLPGSARLKDPTGQAAKKDHSKLAPVKISKGDPVYSEKFTNPTAYAKRMHDVLYPRTRTTEELDKAYHALEEVKRQAGVGILGSDETAQESAGERYSKEEIDLLIKCYMVSHIVRQLEKLVKATKYDVQGLIHQECTLLDFDDEFSASFDFEVIGK